MDYSSALASAHDSVGNIWNTAQEKNNNKGVQNEQNMKAGCLCLLLLQTKNTAVCV